MECEVTMTGELTTERMPSSVNGNPRYRVSVTDSNGTVLGSTRPDSNFVYGMPTDGRVTASYRVTRRGTYFTDIKRANV